MTRPSTIVVLLVAATLFVSACSSSPGDGEDAGTEDASDSAGETDTDSDASTDVGPEGIEVGEACTRPGTCVDGAACVGDTEGEQFRCMLICEEAGRICEDGSFCTTRLNAPPVCYTLGDVPEGDECSVNLDCEPGSLCFGADPEQYCIQGCHAQDDVCDDDEFCDANSDRGPCRSRVGADCETADDCTDDLECTAGRQDELADVFPRGLCTSVGCTTDADCPFESVCRTPPGADTSVCLQPCTFESDCRFNHDYTCLGPTECSDTNNRDACGDFLGSEQLCVPDAFSTAF